MGPKRKMRASSRAVKGEFPPVTFFGRWAVLPPMDLVVQSPEIINSEIYSEICAAIGSRAPFEQKNVHKFPKVDVEKRPKVAEVCERNQLDFAFVPSDRKWSDYKLLVSDMDSTLITIECIDEIADIVGIKPQVSEITAAAMRGELDFSESLRRRVALLKGVDTSSLQKIFDDRVQLTPGADKLIAMAKSYGLKVLLVSGGFTFFTERLRTQVGLDFTEANTLEIVDGKLTGNVLGEIVDAVGKVKALNRHCEILGITHKQVIGMGDGANDLKFLALCDVSIAYHAKPVVRAAVTNPINHCGLAAVCHLFHQS